MIFIVFCWDFCCSAVPVGIVGFADCITLVMMKLVAIDSIGSTKYPFQLAKSQVPVLL